MTNTLAYFFCLLLLAQQSLRLFDLSSEANQISVRIPYMKFSHSVSRSVYRSMLDAPWSKPIILRFFDEGRVQIVQHTYIPQLDIA